MSDQDKRVLAISTELNATDYEKMLNSPEENFRKYNGGLFEEGGLFQRHPELMEALQVLANDEVPEQLPTIGQLNELGAGSYNLWLKMTVADSQGNPVKLDSVEFMAWQRDAADKPVDQWVEENNIAVIAEKQTIEAGDQAYNIEWEPGERRVVGGWRALVSEPREGYYGEIVVHDEQGNAVRNMDGLPDVFMTEEVYNNVASGVPYTDTVIMKDKINDDGVFDEIKIYFGVENAEGARGLEASSFADRAIFDQYEGQSAYMEVPYAEYVLWVDAIAENPDIASQPFGKWRVDQKAQGVNAALEQFIADGKDGNSQNDFQALEKLRDALDITGDIAHTNANRSDEAVAGRKAFLSDQQYSKALADMASVVAQEDLSRDGKLQQLANIVQAVALTHDTPSIDDIAAPGQVRDMAQAVQKDGITL